MAFQLRKGSSALITIAKRQIHGRALIGRREVVGFGMNGGYHYADRPDFPYPAIRWAEPDSKIEPILQKEKGDWKNLSIEEKKALYRYSFRQTFAEMNAPEGIWKVGLGGAFIIIGMSLWCYVFLKKFVYPPMPKSTSEEAKLAQVKRMIGLRMNPIDGIASEYDYEKNCWK